MQKRRAILMSCLPVLDRSLAEDMCLKLAYKLFNLEGQYNAQFPALIRENAQSMEEFRGLLQLSATELMQEMNCTF
jgi:hypothetical protein